MLANSRAKPVAFAEGEREREREGERERRRRRRRRERERERGRRFSGTNVSVCVKSNRKLSALTRASRRTRTGARTVKRASNSAFVTSGGRRIRSLPLVPCLRCFSYTGILEMMESRTAHAPDTGSQQMGEVMHVSIRGPVPRGATDAEPRTRSHGRGARPDGAGRTGRRKAVFERRHPTAPPEAQRCRRWNGLRASGAQVPDPDPDPDPGRTALPRGPLSDATGRPEFTSRIKEFSTPPNPGRD